MIRVIGIGTGPDQVTAEAAGALRACDYVVASAKRDDDPLLRIRAEVCRENGVPLVVVRDPERVSTGSTTGGSASDTAAYEGAVRDWHEARAAAYRAVIEERGGTPGFLVWGDPSLYDSTIRVVSQLDDDIEVVPGVSAPQLLAAAHRMVLHEIGRPVLITTERRLPEALADGADNVVVMLTSGFAPAGVDDWHVWWGANLGSPSARIASGRVADVAEAIRGLRDKAKAEAGWVMDLYLLRKP